MRFVLFVLALYTGDPCVDVCEVLDMQHVATRARECVCYDPASKRVEVFERVDAGRR